VLGQKRIPEFAGTVSGILMGAGWAGAALTPVMISGIAASGWVPLTYGRLIPGLCLVGLLPLLGSFLSRKLVAANPS